MIAGLFWILLVPGCEQTSRDPVTLQYSLAPGDIFLYEVPLKLSIHVEAEVTVPLKNVSLTSTSDVILCVTGITVDKGIQLDWISKGTLNPSISKFEPGQGDYCGYERTIIGSDQPVHLFPIQKLIPYQHERTTLDHFAYVAPLPMLMNLPLPFPPDSIPSEVTWKSANGAENKLVKVRKHAGELVSHISIKQSLKFEELISRIQCQLVLPLPKGVPTIKEFEIFAQTSVGTLGSILILTKGTAKSKQALHLDSDVLESVKTQFELIKAGQAALHDQRYEDARILFHKAITSSPPGLLLPFIHSFLDRVEFLQGA